jgi:hypothetical protein
MLKTLVFFLTRARLGWIILQFGETPPLQAPGLEPAG